MNMITDLPAKSQRLPAKPERPLYLNGANEGVFYEQLNDAIIETADVLSGAAQVLERGRAAAQKGDDDESVSMLLLTKLAIDHSRKLIDTLMPRGWNNPPEELTPELEG